MLLPDTLGCCYLSSQPFWRQIMEGMCKETAPLPSKCGFPGDFLADVRQCMGKNVGLEPKGLSPSKKGPGFKI